MPKFVKNTTNVIQWILIIVLSVFCICMFFSKEENIKKQDVVIQNDDTYIKTYESKKLKELEKENKVLYDSIKNLKNLESAIEIKYEYKFNTDTIYVPYSGISKDSIYNYTYDNDTLKYSLSIKAKELKWHKANFELHDKFTIVNTEDNGKVATIIGHSPNTEIIDVTTWHNKNRFVDNIYYGPSISVGYGLFNNKPDIFVGFSVGWNLNN